MLENILLWIEMRKSALFPAPVQGLLKVRFFPAIKFIWKAQLLRYASILGGDKSQFDFNLCCLKQ